MNISDAMIKRLSLLIERHYSEKLLGYFHEAVKINKSMLLAKRFGVLDFQKTWKQLRADTVFYGAGVHMKGILELFASNEIKFECEIWDKNANNIKEVGNHTVTPPDLETPAAAGQVIVITIEKTQIAEDLRKRFELLGYTVFHGLQKYIDSLT